jgi:hypothetical protein
MTYDYGNPGPGLLQTDKSAVLSHLMGSSLSPFDNWIFNYNTDINIQSDFEIRRTERAESHKDRKYCQVCRSRYPTKFFICVFCFAPEIGNANGMSE